MKLRSFLAITALAIGVHAYAQNTTTPPAAPTLTSGQITYPGYTAKLDQTYVQVGDWQGRLDIYLPPKSNSLSPAVIKIHGGGWSHGSRVSPGGIYFQMGFALINVDYRLVQVASAPAAIEDSRCALKYVKMHAAELNIDPNRIVLEGGSAGGHLVLMTGLLDNNNHFDSNCPGNVDMKVAAIVDDYGPTDLTPALWSSAGGRTSVMGWLGEHANDKAFVASVSPINYVRPDSPPVIIFHGTEDHTVPVEQSRVLEQKLKAGGVPTELVMVTGAGHGKFNHEQTEMQDEKIKEFLRTIGVVK